MFKEEITKEKWVIKFTDTNNYYCGKDNLAKSYTPNIENASIYDSLFSCKNEIKNKWHYNKNAKPQKIKIAFLIEDKREQTKEETPELFFIEDKFNGVYFQKNEGTGNMQSIFYTDYIEEAKKFNSHSEAQNLVDQYNYSRWWRVRSTKENELFVIRNISFGFFLGKDGYFSCTDSVNDAKKFNSYFDVKYFFDRYKFSEDWKIRYLKEYLKQTND